MTSEKILFQLPFDEITELCDILKEEWPTSIYVSIACDLQN